MAATRWALKQLVGEISTTGALDSVTHALKKGQRGFSTGGKLHSGTAPSAGQPLYNPAGPKGFKKIDQTNTRRIPLANVLGPLLSAFGLTATWFAFQDPEVGKYQQLVDFSNWSGTHGVTCKRVYEPEDEEEVQRLVQMAQANGSLIRVVGSGISPNAMAFSDSCMISMALMDKVLDIDTDTLQVRVQAGAKVQDVVEALRPHGLTLQNYASVREQQIGGFTQVSAHGTGAALPPVDEQIVSLRLVAAGLGPATTLSGTDASQRALFQMVKVGLGSMGVVTEVTLQCVPAHRLLEETFVATRSEVRRRHAGWLRANKHLRYMWIPYTDSVVVVKCNQTKRTTAPATGSVWEKVHDNDSRLESMRALLTTSTSKTDGDIADLTAMQLRDELIALNPLDVGWIKKVNSAEAEFWKRSKGARVGWSDEILGFDCGGQQWVLEVAMPTGTLAAPSGKDMEYMTELMDLLEEEGIAAPAPIEQRWSASSSAFMSPAHSKDLDDVHSWVGIIMYLPTEDPAVRDTITAAFKSYAELCEKRLMPKFDAKWHWAKLEAGSDEERLSRVRRHLREHYPVDRFNAIRLALDPENNLGNSWLNSVLPLMREDAE